MTDPQRPSAQPSPPRAPRPSAPAGGFFITVGVVGGILAGLATGQVTLGVLAGLGFGILVALLLWWRSR
ncbi:hypothetical protein ACFX59_16220 [Sphingomonas sp. NCPPB 2930]|uniref:hypothetical protein n=1 Tax=Sphingomonas sp. NCPPB 2930 TaxID=3162788 RepID=UPI0036D84B45